MYGFCFTVYTYPSQVVGFGYNSWSMYSNPQIGSVIFSTALDFGVPLYKVLHLSGVAVAKVLAVVLNGSWPSTFWI